MESVTSETARAEGVEVGELQTTDGPSSLRRWLIIACLVAILLVADRSRSSGFPSSQASTESVPPVPSVQVDSQLPPTEILPASDQPVAGEVPTALPVTPEPLPVRAVPQPSPPTAALVKKGPRLLKFYDVASSTPQLVWNAMVNSNISDAAEAAIDACPQHLASDHLVSSAGEYLRQQLSKDTRDDSTVARLLVDAPSANAHSQLLIVFRPREEPAQAVDELLEEIHTGWPEQKVDSVEIVLGARTPENGPQTKLLACNDLPQGRLMSNVLLCAAQIVKVLNEKWSRVWIAGLFNGDLVLGAAAKLSAAVAASSNPNLVAFYRENVANTQTKPGDVCPTLSFLKSSCYDLKCNASANKDVWLRTKFALRSEDPGKSKGALSAAIRRHIWPGHSRATPESFVFTIPASGVALFNKLASAASFEGLGMQSGGQAVLSPTHTASYAGSTLAMLTAWGLGSTTDEGAAYFAPSDHLAFKTNPSQKTLEASEQYLAQLWETWKTPIAIHTHASVAKSPTSDGGVDSLTPPPTPSAAAGDRISFRAAKFPKPVSPRVWKYKNHPNFQTPTYLLRKGNESGEQTPPPLRKMQGSVRLDQQLCGGVTIVMPIRHKQILDRSFFKQYISALQFHVRRVILITPWEHDLNKGIWPFPNICHEGHGFAACVGWLSRLQIVRDSCGMVLMHADAMIDLAQFFTTDSLGGKDNGGFDYVDRRATASALDPPSDHHGSDVGEMRKFFLSVKHSMGNLEPTQPADWWGFWRYPLALGSGGHFPDLIEKGWFYTTEMLIRAFPSLKPHVHVTNKRFNHFGDVVYFPTASPSPEGSSFLWDETMDITEELMQRAFLTSMIPGEGSFGMLFRLISVMLRGNAGVAPQENATESLIRSFSLLGHCCHYMKPGDVINYAYSAGHKIALDKPPFVRGLRERLKTTFSCTRTVLRVQRLTPKEHQLTWCGTEESLVQKFPTVLASSSTSCNVVLTGGTQKPVDSVEEATPFVPWAAPDAFKPTNFVVQVPQTNQVDVEVPLGTKVNNMLYVIAPNARRVRIRLSAEGSGRQGDNALGRLGTSLGGISIFVATGALTPFSVSVEGASGVPPLKLSGSRTEDIVVIRCSPEVSRKLVAAAPGPVSFAIDIQLFLSPFAVIRGISRVPEPLVKLSFAERQDGGRDACDVSVVKRDTLFPSWK